MQPAFEDEGRAVFQSLGQALRDTRGGFGTSRERPARAGGARLGQGGRGPGASVCSASHCRAQAKVAGRLGPAPSVFQK